MMILRRVPPSVALVCVALGMLTGIAPGQDRDLQRAEALMEARRFRDARELASKKLTAGVPAQEVLLWRWIIAESGQLEGDYEQAAADFDGLSRQATGGMSVEATLRLAKTRLQMWDAEGALEALKRLSPQGAVPQSLGDRAWERDELEAICLFVMGKPNDALKRFEGLSRKSDAGWHYLGLIAFNSGDFKKAVDFFDKAIAAAPGDYYNLLYRAHSLLELGRLDEARAAFREILEFAPTPEVYQLLGRVELRAERFPEAEASLRRALELSPQDSEAQFSLIAALRRQKKLKEAQEAADKFRELHSKQQEDLAYAYKINQEHLARPKDPEPAEALTRHYLSSKDPAAAERMAWRTLTIDPRRVGARLCLARAYAMVGRFQEAAVQYQKILRAQPGNPEAQEELRELVRRHARRADGSE